MHKKPQTVHKSRTRAAIAYLIAASLALTACAGNGADTTTAGDTSPGDTSPGDTSPGDTTAGDTTAGDTTAGDSIDADVREAFDQYVQAEMPGVDIELVQAAKNEGSVVYLTGAYGEGNINAFRERFPFIRMELILLSSGPLAERFMSEKRAGRDEIDVITAPEPLLIPGIEEGFCVSDFVPTSDSAFAESDKIEGTAYRWSGGMFGVVFLPDSLEEGDLDHLDTWEEVFTYEGFDGRALAIPDRGPGAATFTSWATIIEVVGSDTLLRHGEAAGLIRLHAGNAAITNAVLTGELDLGINVLAAEAVALREVGAPIGWVHPEPLSVSANLGCVASNPPNPNAARLLWEFILSDVGQLSMVPALYSYKIGINYEDGLSEALLEEPWIILPAFENRGPELTEVDEDAVLETLREAYGATGGN